MARQSTVNRKPYSASNALDAVARALGEIKHQDSLTWADVGAVLGKSDDQAAKYAEGSATMDFVTFGRARHYWGTRFTCYFDQLCGASTVAGDERHILTVILSAANRISEALEDNGEVDADEVHANRKILSEAFDALGGLLQKIDMGPYLRGVK